MSAAVLIVDDDHDMCRMLEKGLASSGHETASCTSADAALAQVHSHDYDVVITDVRMRGTDGLQLCSRIAESRPDLPVIVITAFGTMETAIEAIRAGAYDFINKPFELETIRLTVNRAAQHRSLSKKVERLEHVLREPREFENMIGSSRAMRAVYDLVGRVAPSEITVLITGESGTGKELVAEALHRRGTRSEGPFVAINCAAMPETLLESELFGHSKGAFTDARSSRQGLFFRAHRGTLFLDEIGELPLSLQPKLLRALQERAARSIGGDEEVSVDARVIVATNRDLESAVEDGRFREDLFYRIQGVQIEMPPLRARGNDVLLLAQHFVDRFSAIAAKQVIGMLPTTAEKLLAYPWPGNVRELQNCMERAVTLCRYAEVTVEDLSEKIRTHHRSHVVLSSDDPSDLVPLDTIEQRYIMQVFEAVGRNKSQAAKVLGLNRKTLYRKLSRYGVLPKLGTSEDR